MPVFDAIVRQVVKEAPGAVSISLDPGQAVEYRAGQFLAIDPLAMDATRALAGDLERRKGRKERPRAYSLSSAPHEPWLSICVKTEPEGDFPALLSPHLVNRVTVGDVIPCSGFNGLYVVPDELPSGAHIVHLCAGSGIVPNFAMIKDLLHKGRDVRQTLVYSNRSWADTIYRDALAALEQAHPGRFRVQHVLTRADQRPTIKVHPDRISEAFLRSVVPDLETAHLFVCGPSVPQHVMRAARQKGETPAPMFLESMRTLLLGLGVDRKRLHTEGW